jgi:hypothetical protein
MEKTIKSLILSLIIGILIFQIIGSVNADLIQPGYSPITITNKITNIDKFPDYVFIVMIDGKVNSFLINDELNIVGSDGIISTPYYKFESVSVYAIKKSELNQTLLENLTNEKAIEYLNQNGKKVIENIKHYETRHISDPVKIQNYEYEIDVNRLLSEPTEIGFDKSLEVKNNLIYFYIGIPVIALIIIAAIILKRKSKK